MDENKGPSVKKRKGKMLRRRRKSWETEKWSVKEEEQEVEKKEEENQISQVSHSGDVSNLLLASG